jgi:hypothetical protein
MRQQRIFRVKYIGRPSQRHAIILLYPERNAAIFQTKFRNYDIDAGIKIYDLQKTRVGIQIRIRWYEPDLLVRAGSFYYPAKIVRKTFILSVVTSL